VSPRLKSVLVLLAVFALGAVSGGALVTARSARRMHRLIDAPPEALQQRFVLTTLQREVDLDASQEEKVNALVASYEAERQAIHHNIGPRIAALRTRLFDDLRGVMRPDQQPAFQRFVKRAERRARTKDR
jgi:hypothetical protein